jgi:hypothetical protein
MLPTMIENLKYLTIVFTQNTILTALMVGTTISRDGNLGDRHSLFGFRNLVDLVLENVTEIHDACLESFPPRLTRFSCASLLKFKSKYLKNLPATLSVFNCQRATLSSVNKLRGQLENIRQDNCDLNQKDLLPHDYYYLPVGLKSFFIEDWKNFKDSDFGRLSPVMEDLRWKQCKSFQFSNNMIPYLPRTLSVFAMGCRTSPEIIDTSCLQHLPPNLREFHFFTMICSDGIHLNQLPQTLKIFHVDVIIPDFKTHWKLLPCRIHRIIIPRQNWTDIELVDLKRQYPWLKSYPAGMESGNRSKEGGRWACCRGALLAVWIVAFLLITFIVVFLVMILRKSN